MEKLANETELNPWRPSVVENVEHTAHTQVGIPLRRAQAVATIRFLRIMGWVAGAGLAGGMAWMFGVGYDWAGLVILGLLFILAAVAVASREPMDAFIAAQLLDISDPFRDSEWRAVQAMRQAQPAPAPPPVVRLEVDQRTDYGVQRVMPDIPGRPEQVISFATGILHGDGFSERTAERAGYSREQWRAIREVFLAHGWCAWQHPDEPRQGLIVLAGGRRVLGRLVNTPIPYSMVPGP